MPGCVEALRERVTLLREAAPDIIGGWSQLYGETFGHSGALGDARFAAWASEDVETLLTTLAGESGLDVQEWFATRASDLRALGVPFEEFALTTLLFGQAVAAVLDRSDTPQGDSEAIREHLDALGHVRLAVTSRVLFEGRPCRDAGRDSCLIDDIADLHRQVGGRDRYCGMVGASLPMQRIYELLTAAARGRTTVFLVGETGTGKELAAAAIHRLSSDPTDRYVPVNCAALPGELMESELFGHRRGAFSGARGDHPGLFRAADGGTIYLDEITELAPQAQAKMLRVIQEGTVRPVGHTGEVSVTVRVIASTNISLDEAMAEGKLRRDLYYRLQGLVIELPPLRERASDIPLLVQHFLERVAIDNPDITRHGISHEAMRALLEYDWPGNVRQLKTAVERASLVARGAVITVGDLPAEVGRHIERRPATPQEADLSTESTGRPPSLSEVERDTIRRALLYTEGNKSRASRLLGISRKQLYVKIERYRLGSLT